MAEQEFLASFGVEIDESGVQRLQVALEQNRELAEELATVSVEDASDPTRDPIETDNSACHAAADCSDAHSNHTARRAGDTADCGSGHGSGYHACDRSSHMIHHIAGFTANNHCHFVEVQFHHIGIHYIFLLPCGRHFFFQPVCYRPDTNVYARIGEGGSEKRKKKEIE